MRPRLKFYAIWFFCALFFMSSLCGEAEEAPQLYARSAVLMDGDSGRILYGVEENSPMPMASTTKIMTCILALEEAEADTVCTASEYASSQPQVKLGMITGETFYLKDLLHSLMLESHNDTAVCIAETVGGSVEGFAQMMNQKAEMIGCRDTYYITPNGLDAQDEKGGHHTTAGDLALVMRYCLIQSPKAAEFLEITQAPSYQFQNLKGDREYRCSNHNALLTILDGALSGKTGFTAKAGYCYVGAVRRDEKLLIVSLLACGWPNNKGYKWVDTKKLVQYGLENFEKKTIDRQSASPPPISVENGAQESVNTRIEYGADTEPGEGTQNTALSGVLMRKDEQMEVETELTGALSAPVHEGQRVGTVRYVLDGITYASYPVVAAGDVEKKDYLYCLSKLFRSLLSAGGA